MTTVKIYPENKPEEAKTITDFDQIKTTVQKFNIGIERWPIKTKLNVHAEQEEILETYSGDITRIMRNHGFSSVDVISMHGSSNLSVEQLNNARNKFLDEHTHSDDEVRFFIDGQGLFCIHEAGKVIQILCKAGDFISVPANTKHWFDMGTEPNFKCIRFFGEEVGWVANYTGNNIASSFPKLEQFEVQDSKLKATL